jgi:hypothetical protein
MITAAIGLAFLEEPVRRALYEAVAAAGMSRDEAATGGRVARAGGVHPTAC